MEGGLCRKTGGVEETLTAQDGILGEKAVVGRSKRRYRERRLGIQTAKNGILVGELWEDLQGRSI